MILRGTVVHPIHSSISLPKNYLTFIIWRKKRKTHWCSSCVGYSWSLLNQSYLAQRTGWWTHFLFPHREINSKIINLSQFIGQPTGVQVCVCVCVCTYVFIRARCTMFRGSKSLKLRAQKLSLNCKLMMCFVRGRIAF